MLDAGFGEPGAEVDGVAVDADGFAGGGGAAFAVEEESQELDGRLQGAAGRGEGVGVGGEAEGAQFLLDRASGPRASTSPYGDVDDGVMRLWAAGDLAVGLLVGDETRTVTVLSIAYAGLG